MEKEIMPKNSSSKKEKSNQNIVDGISSGIQKAVQKSICGCNLENNKEISIMFDLQGIEIEQMCFTNSDREVEELKEKGFKIYLNPDSEDGKKFNANFYILGIAKNLE